MSGPTTGGVVMKVLGGRTASGLQSYRDSKEESEEGYLFAQTRHCSPDLETQIAEWKAVRVAHGTDGAKRAPKATYESVDPETGLHPSGQPGTHIMYFDGRRSRKRLVRPGETPTHLRIEPDELTADVKEAEAVHTIVALGPDLVNPDNPEDLERAWTAVTAWRDERFSGLQESMWKERNGKSGHAHVHIASNATIYQDFTRDGIDYKAGNKMAGALTRVHDVRADFEQWLDAHPEYELQQSLARVGTPEYEAAQRRDGQLSYWENKRGKESGQDRIRREAYEALQSDGVTDRDSFIDEMQIRGIRVSETGLRRGKRGSKYDLLYTIEGSTQGVRGATLGPEYAHDVVDAQLARAAAGQDIELPSGGQRVGEPKPLPLAGATLSAAEQAEFDELQRSIERMAAEERRWQALDAEEAQRAERDAKISADQQQQFEQLQAEATRRVTEGQKSIDAKLAENDETYKAEREQVRAEQEVLRVERDARDAEWAERFSGLENRTPKVQAEEPVIETSTPTSVEEPAPAVAGEPVQSEFDRILAEAERSDLTADMTFDHLGPRPRRAVEAEEELRQNAAEVDEQETAEEVETPELASQVAEGVDDEALDEQEASADVDEQQAAPMAQEAAEAEDQSSDSDGGQDGTPEEPEQEIEAEAAPVAFRSRLRDALAEKRSMSPNMRRKIERLAELEEEYDGRDTDAAFEAAIVDKGRVGGVSTHVLNTYGDYMGDELRQSLTTRAAQRDEDDQLYRRSQERTTEINELRKKDPFGLSDRSNRSIEDLRDDNTFDREYRGRVHEDLAAGRYERRDHAAEKRTWDTEQTLKRGAALNETEPRGRIDAARERLAGDREAARGRSHDDGLER